MIDANGMFNMKSGPTGGMVDGRASIQIERPSLRVFSQADIDAGRVGTGADTGAGVGQKEVQS